MGKNYPKMQCSITIAMLSIFGAKTKIVLTGVRSRVRISLASQLIQYFNSVLFAKTYSFPWSKIVILLKPKEPTFKVKSRCVTVSSTF